MWQLFDGSVDASFSYVMWSVESYCILVSEDLVSLSLLILHVTRSRDSQRDQWGYNITCTVSIYNLVVFYPNQ